VLLCALTPSRMVGWVSCCRISGLLVMLLYSEVLILAKLAEGESFLG
jgi:hypothetical protein